MKNDKIYMREYMRKYNLKHAEKLNTIIHCELCNTNVKQASILKHNKSIKHTRLGEKIKELKEGFSKQELDLLLEKKKLYEAIMEEKQIKEV